MNVKIVCCFHQKCLKNVGSIPMKYPHVFVPLLAGACTYEKGSDKFLDCLIPDDNGVNISDLNYRFSEQTATYWLYKNLKQLDYPDIVGLCHYRRFMDLDYDNLDPFSVYLRRDPNLRIESDRDVLLHFDGLPIVEYILDEFLFQSPAYKEALELSLAGYRFYDKAMFIMSTPRFLAYMDHMLRCYRLLMDSRINEQIKTWRTRGYTTADSYLQQRGCAFLLEMFSSVYFMQMQLLGYPIVITQPSEDSYNEH